MGDQTIHLLTLWQARVIFYPRTPCDLYTLEAQHGLIKGSQEAEEGKNTFVILDCTCDPGFCSLLLVLAE